MIGLVHHRWGLRAAALVLVACVAAPDDGAPAPDAAVDSAADTDAPEIDPLTLPRDTATEQAVVAFLADAAEVHLDDVAAIVDAVHARADAACPRWRTVSRGEMFSEGCVTEDGVTYGGVYIEAQSGFAEWIDAWLAADPLLAALAADTVDAAPGAWTTIDGIALDAVMSLRVPDEPDRELNGLYVQIDGVRPGSSVALRQLTGPPAPSTLPGVPNLTRAVVRGTSGTHQRLRGTLASDDGRAVDADVLLLDPASTLTGRCPAEPEGRFGVREPDGSWRDLVFDAAEGGPCDGCGVVERGGVPVATACLTPDAWSPP